MNPVSLQKYSTATMWLRCRDKDGLLAEISDIITKLGGCSIVGYSGSPLREGGEGEFGMTYTMQLDPKGLLFDGLLLGGGDGGGGGDAAASAADGGGAAAAAAAATPVPEEVAERRLTELDARLTLLHRELRMNGAVLETRLFCNRGDDNF